MRQTLGFDQWDSGMADLISDEEDALDEMERDQRRAEMGDWVLEAAEFPGGRNADVHRS